MASHVNLQVLGIGRGFDEKTLLRVQQLDGVSYAAPTIEESVVVGARPGDPFSGEILRVLGVDLLRPLPRDDDAHAATPGEFADVGNAGPNPAVLVDGRGAIISQRVASRYHLAVGGVLTALSGDRVVRFRVATILPSGIAGLDTSVMFVDIATAQDVFGKVGLLDRIDLIVDDARLDTVQRAVSAAIPHGARAIRPEVRTGEIKRMLRSFQLNLAALSYIAMLVGMYLIYNTVAISVVQRRPDVGNAARARCDAAADLHRLSRRGRALRHVRLAARARARRASRAALGRRRLAHGRRAVRRDARGPRRLRSARSAQSVLRRSGSRDALPPCFRRSKRRRRFPAITMRALGFETRRARPGVGLALCGGGLLVLAYLLTFPPPFDGIPIAGYAAGLAIIFGASLCVPLAIALVAAAAKRFGTRFTPSARIGASNLGSSLRRNSVAVASLMVAIAMMVSVAILIGSFRTTVIAWADETLKADLFVRPLGLQDASYDARFSPAVAQKIRAIPGVAAVDTFRAISIPYHGSLTTLAAADFRTIADRNKLRFLGNVDTRALRPHDPEYQQRRDQRTVRDALRHERRRRRRRRYPERSRTLPRRRAVQRLLDGLGHRPQRQPNLRAPFPR